MHCYLPDYSRGPQDPLGDAAASQLVDEQQTLSDFADTPQCPEGYDADGATWVPSFDEC